jgi:hypothetical protein
LDYGLEELHPGLLSSKEGLTVLEEKESMFLEMQEGVCTLLFSPKAQGDGYHYSTVEISRLKLMEVSFKKNWSD